MSRGLSKRLRFAVFKRDGFACQYCGATPPGATLEVDHIEPVSDGGTNEETNLVTACFNCNRGKANIRLTVVPESLADRAARIAEAEEQLTGYRAIIREHEQRKEDDIWEVFEALYGETEATNDRYRSVKRFLERLPFEVVLDAAKTARTNMAWYGRTRQFLYFCSICWRHIKGEDGE